MKQERATGKVRHCWWCYGVCLICLFLLKPAQDHVESYLDTLSEEPDLLFFSSPELVKKTALGYDHLFADIYWMRTIQYYGRREEAEKRSVPYKNLATLLDITTTLDPYLLDAYRSGCYFLSEQEPIGAGQPEEALKLLDKGIKHHPDEWQLFYDKGFIYFWYMQDYKAAGETWLAGSRLADAPFWMSGLAAEYLSKGGSVELAIALWQRQYEESDRAKIRENARNHLLSFQVARDLWTLEALIDKYVAETGEIPSSLQELLRGKEHKYATVDPLGTPYEFIPETGEVLLGRDSKVVFLEVPEIYKEQLRMTNDE